MYGGDRSRKTTLVDYGFRLPAAIDNRPLKFDEFEAVATQLIFVSATPPIMNFRKVKGSLWSRSFADRTARSYHRGATGAQPNR